MDIVELLPDCSGPHLAAFQTLHLCGRARPRDDDDAAMAEWLWVSRLEAHVHHGHVARPEIHRIEIHRIELVRKLSSSFEADGELSTVSVPPAREGP